MNKIIIITPNMYVGSTYESVKLFLILNKSKPIFVNKFQVTEEILKKSVPNV